MLGLINSLDFCLRPSSDYFYIYFTIKLTNFNTLWYKCVLVFKVVAGWSARAVKRAQEAESLPYYLSEIV